MLLDVLFALWKRGAKTGSYYTRLTPISSTYQFTVDKTMVESYEKAVNKGNVNDVK